jgi:ABC-type branched-subunit amino acid transport system ATPase component/branched-subunit amino acid ABC-type transport system permease component
MRQFLQLVIAGAATGAIYSLIAAGLTVSYTATGIFNLAYGAIAFDSALLYYELNTGLGWSIVPAFLFVIVVFCPLLGLLLNVAVFRPLATAPDAAKIMATVGLLVALPAIGRYIVEGGISTFGWGIPDAKTVQLPPGIWRSPASNSHFWLDVNLSSNQIAVFVVAAIVAVALWYILRHTRLGLQMRAVVDRPDLANLRGVDDGRTSAVAWVMGTVLAGLAGVVGAPVLNSLEINNYNLVMFIAAAAVVLGGLRSVPLAFGGGLFLGVVQNLVGKYAKDWLPFAKNIPGFQNSVPFVLLLVGLLLIARDRNRRSGNVVTQPPPVDWADDLPRWRVQLPWAVAVAVFFVFAMFIVNDVWIGLFANGLAFAVVFMSFVIVTGQGGMVSLAQAAFVLVAAFMTGRFLFVYNWPWILALVVGMLVAMVLGMIVSLPALRLGGLPLALATLALGFLGDEVLFKWNWLRHSQSGWDYRAKTPKLFGINFRHEKPAVIALMIIVGLLTVLVHNLHKSASGRAIIAVRNSEPAAATSGLSIPRTKLSIFALSAAVAGLGGVLVATRNGAIADGTFLTQTGLAWLASVVLFGIRKPQGAILGGLVTATSAQIFTRGFHLVFLPSFLHWDGLGSSTATYVQSALFGIGAIQLARQPDGVLAITAKQNRARRDKRRAKSGGTVPLVEIVEAARPRARVDEPAVAAGADIALSVHDIHSGYGLVEVLHGVSFSLPKGHITAILGPNGAGKSTTCLTLAGLLRPSSGTIHQNGTDVTALVAHRRAKRGVVMAPESRGIFPGLTVQANLALWLPDAAQHEQAYARFPILGERRGLPAGNLSGGEQQILTLTPLLVRPPDVLIADEPSLGLAPLIVEQVMSIFVELRERGVALLLVEEKARDVLEIADSVAFLSLGEITWHGPRSAVDADRLAEAYLGAR